MGPHAPNPTYNLLPKLMCTNAAIRQAPCGRFGEKRGGSSRRVYVSPDTKEVGPERGGSLPRQVNLPKPGLAQEHLPTGVTDTQESADPFIEKPTHFFEKTSRAPPNKPRRAEPSASPGCRRPPCLLRA